MKYLLLLLCLCASLASKSQHISSDVDNLTADQKEQLRHKIINEVAKKMNVSILKPDGYYLIDRAISSFDCDGNKGITNPSFVFIKKDSNVVITISLMARDSTDYEKLRAFFKRFHPELKGAEANPDSSWRLNFKARADTINFKYEYYSKLKLNPYNADEAIEFSMACPNPFLNKYTIARALTLDKKYRGIIDIYYFIRKGYQVDIAKEIQKNLKLIRYN